MAEKDTYEALEQLGAWAPSSAGQGIVPQLGQRPVAVPRGGLHTEGWGASVRLGDVGSPAAGGDEPAVPAAAAAAATGTGGPGAVETATEITVVSARSTAQRAVALALQETAQATGRGTVEHGVARDASCIPPPATQGPTSSTVQAAMLRVSSEIAAAAAAALNVPHDAALQTEFTEDRVQRTWRHWLLQTLRTRGVVFPAADQPPLTEEGYVDMAKESATERNVSSEADALHENVGAYPVGAPAAYVALTVQADRDRTMLYPWPQSLKGCRCRHDHHTFDGPPVAIPVQRNAHNIYVMRWAFCSVPCAIAFIDQSGQTAAQKTEQRANLAAFVHEVLAEDFLKNAPGILREAAPLDFLTEFGGQYDIDAWRMLNAKPHTHFFTTVPPYMPGYVMHAVQSRDTAFLKAIRTGDTVRPPSSNITVPRQAVPREVIVQQMQRVAEQQQHGASLYAQFVAENASDERQREHAAAQHGFSDAGLYAKVTDEPRPAGGAGGDGDRDKDGGAGEDAIVPEHAEDDS